jgi:type II secretory pathway component PulC
MPPRIGIVAILLSVTFLVAACGGSTEEPAHHAPRPTASVSVSAPRDAVVVPPVAQAHSLRRSDVEGVIGQGLGVFLQRIEVDAVLASTGAFRGFRVAALHDEPFWRGVDLKPGDIVTSVNGFPIEHPEQAQVAFDSLHVSSELRVAYERDGAPRELVYSIVP